MRQLVAESGLSDAIEVDSAGTGDWHVGESPDRRSVAAARARGIRVEGRARQFRPGDWARFDYVLAMDASNLQNLRSIAPAGGVEGKLFLLRSFDPAAEAGDEVPDPYFGSDGFDLVIDLCHRACSGLLAHIRREHGLA